MNDGGQIAVLCVGDVTTDAYIKIGDESAGVIENAEGKWLAIPFGAKIPYDTGEVVEAGGNASNASIAFAKFGLKSALLSNVGEDYHGREIINALHRGKVDTRFVRVNPGAKTNYNFVLWYKNERTILVKHHEYDYHWPHIKPTEVPKWLYLSSIHSEGEFHADVAKWLQDNPGVKLAFQPGTSEIGLGPKKLEAIYKRAHILAVNKEEAKRIAGKDANDVHVLLNALHDLGPKIVVISDGPNGSYASDGISRFKMPIYPDPTPPVERTGAGDAFTATFVASIIKGNNIEGALQIAPINSMSVVQNVGPHSGLLSEREINELLKKAPDSYRTEVF